MRQPMRIYIVEDDEVIARGIKQHLESWGFEVECAEDFKDVLTQMRRFDPQLVLMDLSLPYWGGYHWCAEIRRESKAPVIFISSAADDMNIVMAMDMGGDDFIAKPFDLHVLTAKVRAMLRRSYDFAEKGGELSRGGAVLNTADASLAVDGVRIELTKNEYRILAVLMEAAGNIVSRDALMTRLWENDSYVDENTLTVNVNRLRRKLADAGLPDFIVTKRGMGYMVM